jgi:CheY-like chemotaxis protein/anti-sigma regulatory factor (Ser/Thr protein kinase)
MTTLLAIDDEPKNLKLIRLYLADTDYTVLTAVNGEEGWKTLTETQPPVDVILLDRMMPVMDGMEFMSRLRANPEFAHLPVVMQTAAAETSQVAEGIRAGVFYYLTKPYDSDVLLSIVQSALQHHGIYSGLRASVKKYKNMIGLITESHFEFHTLEEAHDLTVFLANFFPDPERMVLGISELLINAIEHGNLGITYEEKSDLTRHGCWEQEIQRRVVLPEYNQKRVRVHYEKRADEIILTISDEGEGFEWQRYLDMDPDRATDSHGRGIAMSRMVSFDSLQYEGCGNTVTCMVHC